MEFCFVCNRVTDHFAEHDALVEAGLATYRNSRGEVDGTVRRTELWNDALAAEVSRIEYREYSACFEPGGGDPLALDLAAIVAEARANLAA